MEASIYVLVDPRDGEIRYVGWSNKTLDQRLKRHLRDTDDNHRTRWIAVLRREGFVPIIRLLQLVPRGDWADAERYWVRTFIARGCPLVNGTGGGDGTLGHRHSKETRSRIGAKHRGKSISREQRARLSVMNKGASHTEEAKRKISEAQTGRKRGPMSLEQREKLSLALKGRPLSLEHRQALSAGLKGRIVSEATRSKLSTLNKGKTLSTEHRAKISATMRRDEYFTECAKAALKADFDPVPWEDAPVWRRTAAYATADAALNTNNPDFTRMAWFESMCSQGWRWDRIFDEQKKTHPGIVTGELTRGGSRHWENVVKQVRDVGRRLGVRMLGP